MIDRIFSAALTFCLLTAGTLAIGSALFGLDSRVRPMPMVQLPTVTVTGQRQAMQAPPAAIKTLADANGSAECADGRAGAAKI